MKRVSDSMLKSLRSFRYAFKGIAWALMNENNFIYHLAATLAIVIAGLVLKFTQTEWFFIVAMIGFVYTAEIVNSAIEKLVDLTTPRYHYKAGIIKDMAAGAVLVAAVTALIVGAIIISNHI